MQEKVKKIDNDTAEITVTKTVVEKQVVNLSSLIYERDSLVRTKNMETDEFNLRMNKIDMLISDMNDKIKALTDIGLKVEVVSPDVVVE